MDTRIGSRHIAACALAACLAASSHARAQTEPNASDSALAQSLFDSGRALMAEQRYAEACPKLAESFRIDAAAGTFMNLALCHEAEGRIATAWAEFNEALSRAVKDGRPDREASAREHIAALAPKLPRLTITVPAEARAPGLEIKLDGLLLREAAWANAPLDPGHHVVSAAAPGKKAWAQDVDVTSGGATASVAVPRLEDGPAQPAPAGGAPGGEVDHGPQPTQGGGSTRTLGWIVGGVGLAAVGVGTVFGIRALSKRSDSDAQCPSNACNAKGVSLNDEAKTSAWIANIGIGVGLVGIGVGTYLLLTSPSATPERPRASRAGVTLVPTAGASGSGASLVGRF